MTWVQTYTGRAVSLTSPDPETIDPDDIAHSLARICRFAGAVDRFYSVAEHSAHMADHVYHDTGDPRLALAALLHDAHEAYIGDIPSPVGRLIGPALPRLKRRLDDAIEARFGATLDTAWIHELDRRILVDERAALMKDAPRPWGNEQLAPLGIHVQCWVPEWAEHQYRTRLAAWCVEVT